MVVVSFDRSFSLNVAKLLFLVEIVRYKKLRLFLYLVCFHNMVDDCSRLHLIFFFTVWCELIIFGVYYYYGEHLHFQRNPFLKKQNGRDVRRERRVGEEREVTDAASADLHL